MRSGGILKIDNANVNRSPQRAVILDGNQHVVWEGLSDTRLVSVTSVYPLVGFGFPALRGVETDLDSPTYRLPQLSHANVMVRQNAALVLAQLNEVPDEVLSAAIERLEDGDATVRAHAMTILQKTGPRARKAIPKLISFYLNDQSQVDSSPAYYALCHIGPEAAPPLLAAFNDRSGSSVSFRRSRSVGLLAYLHLGLSGEVDDALKAAFKDEDVQVRRSVAEWIGFATRKNPKQVPDFVPTVALALQDSDSKVVRGTLWSLRQMGELAEKATPAVLNTAEQAQFRVDAISALGMIGQKHPRVLERLISYLNANDSPEVTGAAAWAIGRYGEHGAPAVPALVKALKDERQVDAYGSVRKSAVFALDD